MRKRLLLFILLILLPINVFALDINSKNIYFYNLDRDEVIYEVNAHEEISIASLTKIMTAIVAIENIDNLDGFVILTDKDFKGLREANASTAGFKVGEVVTYRDLLYGLMLPSGADAALALANNIAGSEDKFVLLMNQKALALGLKNTRFVNTTGLDENGHYSSVYDIYFLLDYALKNKNFKEIFTTQKYVTSNKRLTLKSTLYTTSKRYNINVDYILGSKSGYTYDAGLCLASIAENNGEIFLLVTAGADYKNRIPYHIQDSNKIYKYYFENYNYRTILERGDILVTLEDSNGKKHIYKANKNIEKYISNKAKIKKYYDGVETLTSDFKRGDLLGVYNIYVDDELVYTHDIYLEEEVIDYEQVVLIISLMSVIVLIVFKLKKKIKKKRTKKGKKK